jgi:hypothetical protein
MSQIWCVGQLGDGSHQMLRQKFTNREQCVSRFIVVVQHPDLVSSLFRPLTWLCLPQTLHAQVKLFIDCLTTWNKLTMNNALPIKRDQHLHISLTLMFYFRSWHDFLTHCNDWALTLKSLSKSCCQYQTEFHKNMLLFRILHISACKNHKRHRRWVHSTACIWWLIDVVCQAGVRFKLKVTTIQRHCHNSPVLAPWCPV